MRVSVIGSASILSFLFFLQACAPKPQQDCGFVRSSSQQRVSLKNQTQFPLKISSEVPKEYIPEIEASIKEWEEKAGRKFFKIVDTNFNDSGEPKQDGSNVIYWKKTWDTNRRDEQARTTIVWDQSARVIEGDVKMNARDFEFYIDAPLNQKQVHFRSVMVHELGHIVGLKHRDTEPSVMSTELSSKTVRDEPRQADVESIKCEYK